MTRSLDIEGLEFSDCLNGNDACYYDWLRTSANRIVGLKFFPYWEGKQDFLSFPYVRRRQDGCFEHYFSTAESFVEGMSADQTDEGAMLLINNDGCHAITFQLEKSALSSSEVDAIRDAIKPGAG